MTIKKISAKFISSEMTDDTELANEATLRENADVALVEDIAEVAGNLATEIISRSNADNNLQNNINLKYDASNPSDYRTGAQVSSAVDAHANLKTNPHEVTKTQVGLGNVDNTSDVNKPVSTAQQTALNLKYNASNPNGYETPSQLNTRDTNNRARASHTGTQASSTISDFATTVRSTLLTGVSFASTLLVTATDSLLIAIGKLQSQITNLEARVRSVAIASALPVTATKTTYTAGGEPFIWVQSRNAKYKNGTLIFDVTYFNRVLSVRIYDTTNATVLGEVTGINSSGIKTLSFNNPIGDAYIEIQVLKASGGTSPIITAAAYEFDTN